MLRFIAMIFARAIEVIRYFFLGKSDNDAPSASEMILNYFDFQIRMSNKKAYERHSPDEANRLPLIE